MGTALLNGACTPKPSPRGGGGATIPVDGVVENKELCASTGALAAPSSSAAAKPNENNVNLVLIGLLFSAQIAAISSHHPVCHPENPMLAQPNIKPMTN
jgi:hypothetical protein